MVCFQCKLSIPLWFISQPSLSILRKTKYICLAFHKVFDLIISLLSFSSTDGLASYYYNWSERLYLKFLPPNLWIDLCFHPFLYIPSLTIPKVSSILFEVYCSNFSTCDVDSILSCLFIDFTVWLSFSICLSLLLIFSMYPSLVTLAHQYLNIWKPNQTKAIKNSQKSLLITIFFNDQTFLSITGNFLKKLSTLPPMILVFYSLKIYGSLTSRREFNAVVKVEYSVAESLVQNLSLLSVSVTYLLISLCLNCFIY